MHKGKCFQSRIIINMGCSQGRGVAMEELQDIANLLKTENACLEDEKEKLLSDQIHKPADDKEITKCLTDMAKEVKKMYGESRDLLIDFVDTISRQLDNSPEIRIVQILEARSKLEEIGKRIDNFYLQKRAYAKLNTEIQLTIEQNEREIYEKSLQIQNYKILCTQLKLE